MRVSPRTAAYWASPPLLAAALYWPGLICWFQKDDFAWLNLRNLMDSGHSLWWALFTPFAQGTIRPLSERVFFLSFYSMFGMNPLPYRIMAFLTCAAVLILIMAVCARLTGSRAAAWWAAVLWIVNEALAVAMSWTAIYYELLCAFFLLLSFWFLLRFVETKQWRFYVAQCAAFLVGFLVLELNVVYPALAVFFVLCCAREVLFKTLPLFAASGIYAAVHIAAAPLQAGGPYRMHWDQSVVSTLWTYWQWALGPARLTLLDIPWAGWPIAIEAGLMAGLIGFLVCRLWRRRWVAAFFPAWFLIVLAPVLPLRDHISDYYLTIPLIGLAMWGGWALVSGWRAGTAARIAAGVLLVSYLAVSVPVARHQTLLLYYSAKETKRLVLGVASLSHARPDTPVLLTGVSSGIFWSVVHHHPFRLFGLKEVYLASAGNPEITNEARAAMPDLSIDPALEKSLLDGNQAVVYNLGRGEIRDTTAQYRALPASQAGNAVAALVDAGNPIYDKQLGLDWYPNEGGFRWMPKHATVKLRGPSRDGEKLYLKGSCPGALLKAGPLKMRVSVDGELLGGEVRIPEGGFAFEFKLPASVTGRAVVEVSVDLDHTSHPVAADPREFGLAFGTFEIR